MTGDLSVRISSKRSCVKDLFLRGATVKYFFVSVGRGRSLSVRINRKESLCEESIVKTKSFFFFTFACLGRDYLLLVPHKENFYYCLLTKRFFTIACLQRDSVHYCFFTERFFTIAGLQRDSLLLLPHKVILYCQLSLRGTHPFAHDPCMIRA